MACPQQVFKEHEDHTGVLGLFCWFHGSTHTLLGNIATLTMDTSHFPCVKRSRARDLGQGNDSCANSDV